MPIESQIGVVSHLVGEASARSPLGDVRTLAADAEVFQDDTITTGGDSSVELRFEDGTVFSQGADSQVLLDVYVYDAAAGDGELLFNLARGSLRAVSGEIAKLNPEGFNVQTPLATVGIRGTGFFVLLTPDGQVVGVEQMDPTHVVVVETALGEMTIARQGEFVAVQLDGFLSDPTLFTPEFLQGVQDMVPMHLDPPESGPDAGQDSGDGQDGGDNGQNGEGEVPQEVLDDLTDALQALQALGDTDALQEALGALQGAGDGGEAGDGVTDTLEELYDLLGTLQDALPGGLNQAGNLADDILFGNPAEDVISSINIHTLDLNTDGSGYSAQLAAMGYTNVQPTGDNDNNCMFGTNGSDVFDGSVGNDILFGGLGNDSVLNGNSGNDCIYGGIGDDLIIGGSGEDYLVGGDGNDIFRYGFMTDGGDVIRDFTSGQDVIQFQGITGFNTNGSWTKLSIDNFSGTYTGSCSDAVTIYDPISGKVYHDPDGCGSSAAELICTLEGAPTVDVNNDFENY